LKKSIKLWLAMAVIVLLAVVVPAIVLLPGCTSSDDSSSETITRAGNVEGTVTSSGNGNPIENVTVTIVEKKARKIVSDETDVDGKYKLENVASGTQTITATLSGYANVTDSVVVETDKTVTKNISMTAVEGGSVSGVVTNAEDSSNVIGAKVQIGEISAISGDSGSYTLNGVPAGNQVLRATANSFADYQATIVVPADEALTQNVSIQEANKPTTAPQEGKATIYGRVNDSYDKPVTSATVNLFGTKSRQDPPTPEPSPSPTPVASTDTDTNGTWTSENIEPDTYRVEAVKTGYTTSSQTVIATVDKITRVDTVKMGGGPSPTPSPTGTGTVTPTPTVSPTAGGTTKLCSEPRTAQTRDSLNPCVDNVGKYVAFESNEPILAIHTNPAVRQIYLNDAGAGTTVMVSMIGTNTVGDINSLNSTISPAGDYVAFASDATNLLGPGGDANNFRDIFLYKVADKSITRLSTLHGNTAVGGNGHSDNPFLGAFDGAGSPSGKFFCAFESDATNLTPATVTGGNRNIFRADINKANGTSADVDIVSQLPAGTGKEGGDGPSTLPGISADGKYICYQSTATDLHATVPAPAVSNIFICNMENTIATRTTIASTAAGLTAPAAAINSQVTDDGKYVSFEIANSAGVWGNNGFSDCFRSTVGTGVDLVSGSPGGTVGNSLTPSISSDGKYIAFYSESTGLVQGDTNNSPDIFVRDMDGSAGQSSAYTMVSVDSNGVIASDTSANANPNAIGSQNPYISGPGSYVVFQSGAQNLASSTYIRPNMSNIYQRKWK